MNMSFSLDYDAVVRDAVDSTLVALKASHATPSVKRFVLTSDFEGVSGRTGSKQELNSRGRLRSCAVGADGIADG